MKANQRDLSFEKLPNPFSSGVISCHYLELIGSSGEWKWMFSLGL